jgi:hypothetical protein
MSTNRPPQFHPLRFVSVKETVLVRSRYERIAELAYFRALQRDFEPGRELEDWLAAEAEIDQRDP